MTKANRSSHNLALLTAGLALLVATAALGGCDDKSPPASQEALNSKGAQKSASFEQMKSNTTARNPGAPGSVGK